MPKLKENQVPAYRLHKQSGQAIVTLNGRDVLLGKHGTKESKDEYLRVTNEWRVTRGVPRTGVGTDLTVAELVLAFWRHAKTYYRKDGKPTTELYLYKMVLKLLRQLYGRTSAAEFGPKRLKAVMHAMVERKWCRTSINKHASRIKHVFKWAVEVEIVPGSVYHSLLAVSGLSKGRTEAEESVPVRPVDDEDVEAILSHVSRQVQSLIRLQLLTGMRPGEAVTMRGCDLTTTGKLWLYKPESHKTQHHGHDRVIYLGEQAKTLIQQFLKPNPQAYLFSPADAEAERREKLHTERLKDGTPINQGNKPGSNRNRGGRKLNEHYTVNAYAHAIVRGCERAFGMPGDLNEPRTKAEKAADTAEKKARRQKLRAAWRAEHTWHPHQLRHNAATRLRKDYGLEAAQVILGHKTLAVTELYAEKNVQAAQRIMAEVG